MQERVEQFLGLSVILTGFSRVQLLGTGVTDEYLQTLDKAVPASVLNDLLTAYKQLPPGPDQEAAVASKILADPKLGPVAQNIILLWYCGTWTLLADTWYASYGAAPGDVHGVISADSYQAGLQWTVAGGHPPGSRQQGFAAWSSEPGRSTL
jgi:hypothetical protein